MKFARALLATGLFLLLFALGYLAWMRWMRVDVLLYATLFVALLAALLAALALFALRAFAPLSRFEKLQLVVIWLLLGYAIAISGPTLIDRSLSFYLLETIDQRGGIRVDGFDTVVTREFMRDHRLIAARLTEQLASGTIRLDGDCVRLTDRGRRLARFSQFVRRHLLPRHRRLLDEYSDVLTRPRTQTAAPDYLCAGSG